MRPSRRFICLAGAIAALPVASRVAIAQTYPARPVHIIVGFPAGGGADILMRLLAQRLSAQLGQPFIVENILGASSNIAAGIVARATSDGYTLLSLSSSNAINATLYNDPGFNFVRDIELVGGIVRVNNVMVINPSFVAQTVPEFISYAKANPGKINIASAGVGSTSHLAGELFKVMTGVNMVHVPYNGAPPALVDLLVGRVQVMFENVIDSLPSIRAGTLRPLAMTSTTRSDLLPDVPTLNQFVPGFEASAWWAMGAPQGTPTEIIYALNQEINAALSDPTIEAQIVELGGLPVPMTMADLQMFIASEIGKWGKVIGTSVSQAK
jgi:tripartite-type tricarboxylate transporter receptor subunit TctC